MKNSIRNALCVVTVTLAMVSAAQASVLRTFVSGAGNDSNSASNCSLANPCRTLAVAYSITQAGGDIVALDLAGYGPLTITHPITIFGSAGIAATAASNTTAITISAGASDLVVLRNMRISGVAGSSNTVGIKLNTGKLILQDSTLTSLSDGLLADSTNNGNSIIRAYLTNVDITANTRGITTNGAGVDTSGTNPPRSGNVEVLVWGGNVLGNGTAFRLLAAGKNGNQNRLYTIFLGQSGTSQTVNVQGNTTVASGTNPGCENGCDAVQTYNTSSGTPQDPNP